MDGSVVIATLAILAIVVLALGAAAAVVGADSRFSRLA